MLTLKQKRILNFIEQKLTEREIAPTHAEIAKHFRLSSVSTVHEHLQALQKKGYLNKLRGQARAMTTNGVKDSVTIPLFGIIAAGGPIEAIINTELIEVPRNMLSTGAAHYALRVSGVSMIEEGISDGDIVIIRNQSTVENGEKAVAYMPDRNEVTLKKIYKEKNRIKLVPANKYMKPFYETNVQIQGRVMGVLRKEI